MKYDEAEQTINGYDDENGYKNERLLPIIYELDSRKEWHDAECWAKANPGLGSIKRLDQLAAKVAKAQKNPGARQKFIVQRLQCPRNVVRSVADI
jgi:phage terminase large subunit-like protein